MYSCTVQTINIPKMSIKCSEKSIQIPDSYGEGHVNQIVQSGFYDILGILLNESPDVIAPIITCIANEGQNEF